jgi:hypothetical protein
MPTGPARAAANSPPARREVLGPGSSRSSCCACPVIDPLPSVCSHRYPLDAPALPALAGAETKQRRRMLFATRLRTLRNAEVKGRMRTAPPTTAAFPSHASCLGKCPSSGFVSRELRNDQGDTPGVIWGAPHLAFDSNNNDLPLGPCQRKPPLGLGRTSQ